jgi:NAD(P)-dependent dehydrogenase (short-subunit alcohol dehydrogenase family)
MKDSALRLQDKTLLVVGPFNGITQSIIRAMTEFGADVGFVCEGSTATRYVDGVNEAREVHPHYGRAAHYNLPLGNDKQIQDAFGRVVESLGRMDALIDASPLEWTAETNPEAAVAVCLDLAEKVVPFLLAKQRGRIVYLFEDPSLDKLKTAPPAEGSREVLTRAIQALALKYRLQNVTANALSVGVTDDFLLKNLPKSPSLKRSFEELQRAHAGIKLVEFHDIALGAAYLCSALSASLTGQVLRLTHGYHLGL